MSDSRLEELQQELSRRKELENELSVRQQAESSPEQNNTGMLNVGGGQPSNRTPMDVLRDVSAGVARGSQNLGSALLEGGEYVTRKGAEKLGRSLGHPVEVPYWNAREFAGLEGKNPIDLGAMIQGKNPDALSQMIGQFGPAIAAGGPNLLRQMAMQGGYGASQAKPDEQNALGLLPQGRLGAGLSNVGGVFAGAKLLPLMARGTGNLLSNIKNAFTKVNAKEIAQSVQASHDALEKSAEDIFENVGKTAKARGADVVPIDSKIIDKVKPYLADTRAVKKFLEKAGEGDYSSLRKLQADLFRSGTKAEKANTLADDLKSQEIFDLRDRINESISKHFRKNGHDDLADMLNKARGMYRNLKQTYYNKKLPMAVRDLVHPDVRKIPRNSMNTFSEESKPMQRLVSQNPLLAKNLQIHKAKKNSLDKLKNLGVAGSAIGGTAGLGYGTKKSYDYFTGD